MELLKGKALSLAIAQLGKDLKQTIATIEYLAKSACVEAVNTGNTTHLNKLADVTQHIGSRALMRWIAKHGPVTYDTESGTFQISDKKREAAKADIAAYTAELEKAPGFVAAAKPSDGNPFKGMDLTARVKSLIKQAKEVMADPERKDAEGNNFAILSQLETLIANAPVKISATAGKPESKPKHGKVRKLTAETETVATA